MAFDVGTPFRSTSKDRVERFLVSFDGFIKNASEGMIRTMKRDEDDYLLRYPDLSMYHSLTREELYDQTMLYPPRDLLRILSRGELSEEEIEKDIQTIFPDIYLNGSLTTSFEFALHEVLEHGKVEVCYIYKEDSFYTNEIAYLQNRYESVLNKIQIIQNASLDDIYHDTHPTTIYTPDCNFVLDYIRNQVLEEEKKNQLFVLLHTYQTVHEDPTDQLLKMDPEFLKIFKENDQDPNGFLLAVMYNLRVDLPEEPTFIED